MQGVREALWMHCGLMAVVLVSAGVIAKLRGVLHWRSSTFWSLSAFTLYFLLNPLVSLLTNDLRIYYQHLESSGGAERIRWVTILVGLALVAFLATNMFAVRGRELPPLARWDTSTYKGPWPPGTVLVLCGSLAAVVYSLFLYRGAFGTEAIQATIERGGRFVGEVTGYQKSLYMLVLVPVVLLLIEPKHAVWGWILGALYILGRLYDPWDRASVVSPIIAMSLVAVTNRRTVIAQTGLPARERRWPSAWWVIGVLGMTVLMQVRAHQSIETWAVERPDEPEEGWTGLVAGPDTSMLPGLCTDTFVDEQKGWTYGSDIVTRVLFGALPRRYFPWKDELEFWLTPGRAHYVAGEDLMYRKKSSLIGSFYRIGGLLGAFLLMALLGWVLARAEVFLSPAAASPIRAIAIVWFSMLWIMWAGSAVWSLRMMFMSGLPGLLIIALHGAHRLIFRRAT